MRFLLDENETRTLLLPLVALYPMHTFDSSVEVFGSGVEDVALIHGMRDAGYDSLITRDSAQLDNEHERAALYETGIHWIGHRALKAKGVELVSTLASTYTLAMPTIVRALEDANGPMAIRVLHAAKRGGDIVRTGLINPQSNPFKVRG